MQQYYTLEEAAQKLGMSVDELREMAKKKQIRAFQDRGNWRFRAQEIDEKARQLGVNSDPEVQLGDSGKSPRPVPRKPGDSDSGKSPRPAPRKPSESDAVDLGKKGPKAGSDSDVRLVMDESGAKVDSDVRLQSPTPKKGGDSGVRLDQQESDSDVKLVGDSASDSDIRLHELPPPAKKKGDAGVITEEIDLDAEQAKLKDQPKAKPGKPRGPATQVNKDLPILPTSSPYELSEPDIGVGPRTPQPKAKPKDKGTKDSSSEHELIAFDEAKVRGGDLGSGEIPLLSDSGDDISLGDLPPPGPGNSGINLDDPVDSGISLEDGSDELEFELSLDSGNTPRPEKNQPAAAEASSQEDSSSEFELSLDDAPSDTSDSEFELSLDEDASGAGSDVGLDKIDNSDSEFELTLDEEGDLGVGEGGGKDIFEETNFDLPPLEDESQSEAVALEEPDTDLESSGDFDLSMEDDSSSGSQVVDLEMQEDADDAAATVAKARAPAKKKPAKPAPKSDEPELDFGDLEEEDDKKPKKGGGKKPAIDDEPEEEEEEKAAAAPVEWGPLPAVLLFPTVIVLFFVGLMGFELVQGMWGYHRSTKVGRPIIDTVARMFDDKIPKE